MSRYGLFTLRWATLVSVLLGAAFLLSCAEDHSQFAGPAGTDPDLTGLTPPVPRNLTAQVGDLRIILTWTVDDPSIVASYRVFRREGLGAEEILASGVAAATYTDTDVTNGTRYEYRVASTLDNGLVGRRSSVVTVVPGPFSVLINGGDRYTNNRVVSVEVGAAPGTTSMRLGETEDLSSESWRSFDDAPAFELSAAEGAHTVYVQFRDATGNPTEAVHDDIILDTRAQILTVTHDGGSDPVPPGTTIHFTIATGEAEGSAAIDIGSARTDIPLFDDGQHGDGAANDGTYAVDFETPIDLEIADAPVIGRFRDAAGNLAPERSASGTLTLNEPPAAVTLDPPFNIEQTTLDLRWSRSVASDFASYRVFRSQTTDPSSDPARELVDEITDAGTTGLTDDGLTEGATYYYLVQTTDELGSASASNIVSATMGDLPPEAVPLSAPGSIGETQMTLSWSRSPSDDFAAYVLYRGFTGGVDDSGTQVVRQTNREVLSVIDTGLVENTRYFYRLYVEDAGGQRTPSDPVSATTLNVAPPAVVLSTVSPLSSTTMQLAWTQSDAHDFASYTIRRDESAIVDESSTLVRTVANRTSTSLVDSGLRENTRYYYRVFVTDTADSTSASAVGSAVTMNAAPPPVALTEVGHTTVSVSLSWDLSTIHDFDRYRIMRASESPPGIFTEVGTFTDPAVGSYTHFFAEVTSPTVFFYKVITVDSAGASTDSNVISVTITP
jgi:fibronectin type 3 domain-containing protein